MILSLALLLSGRLDTRPAQQLQAEEAAASPPRQSEVRSSHSPGETTLRVLEAGGFRVGAVVRIHEGHPNQEDHRVRYITPSTLRLEGAGLELHHNRGERVVQLAVDEDLQVTGYKLHVARYTLHVTSSSSCGRRGPRGACNL